MYTSMRSNPAHDRKDIRHRKDSRARYKEVLDAPRPRQESSKVKIELAGERLLPQEKAAFYHKHKSGVWVNRSFTIFRYRVILSVAHTTDRKEYVHRNRSAKAGAPQHDHQ